MKIDTVKKLRLLSWGKRRIAEHMHISVESVKKLMEQAGVK